MNGENSMPGMDFGQALNALKSGERVARAGWNGKGMWLALIHPGNAMFTKFGSGLPMQPCIGMKTADSLMQPGWLASQSDMLAEDWFVVAANEVAGPLGPLEVKVDLPAYVTRQAKHEGLPVKGYVPQSTAAVDLVNENKELEERVLRQCDKLGRPLDVDKRWLAIARTHIEEGFMAMNRAVFRPKRVSLPEDAACEGGGDSLPAA